MNPSFLEQNKRTVIVTLAGQKTDRLVLLEEMSVLGWGKNGFEVFYWATLPWGLHLTPGK